MRETPESPASSGTRPRRRQEFSSATRRDLTEVAERLFTDHGYAATSLDSVVAGARVTKGALYHHFSSKQGLFEAVLDRLEEDSAREIERAVAAHADPWEQALAGLRCFLEVVRRPAYRRVVIQEGPSVLGYERFREEETRSTFHTIRGIVRGILGEDWGGDEERVVTFSRLFFGALNTAGSAVAGSADPEAESARVELVVGLMLAAMRDIAAGGADVDEIAAAVRASG